MPKLFTVSITPCLSRAACRSQPSCSPFFSHNVWRLFAAESDSSFPSQTSPPSLTIGPLFLCPGCFTFSRGNFAFSVLGLLGLQGPFLSCGKSSFRDHVEPDPPPSEFYVVTHADKFPPVFFLRSFLKFLTSCGWRQAPFLGNKFIGSTGCPGPGTPQIWFGD